jgi:hypothetical protein
MNVERGGEFAVAEIVTAQEKQFCLTRWQGCKNGAHPILLFGSGVELFGRGVATNDGEQVFVAGAASLAAELIESEAHSGAIQPGFGLRRVGAGSTPEPNECFDGEFLGASGVADDSGDYSCDAIESCAEERLDVEGWGGRRCCFEDDVAGCVHIHINDGR